MGARPICSVNSLRFGPITPPPAGNGGDGAARANNRRVFSGVVAGIAHYGNCFGIPTIAGEVYFDKSYEGNPLVNAFCLGVLRHEQIARGAAKGIGNPVFYVGPATGRDGLAGAAFASQDLTEESAEQQRGAVQVGDPFMEKLVCEACLELLATGAVAGIQDMGAAGLTCSTAEMGARAGTGVEIDIARVPKRETGMTAYEVMLSESQERMLLVAEKGREQEVARVFEKWDLHAEAIGTVTADGRLRVFHDGRPEADVTPFDLMPPEEAERVTAEFGARVRAHTPLTGLENVNLHKDGHLVVLETNGVPVFDAEGRFKGYRGIDRDITERKQAEQKIQGLIKEQLAILDTSAVGVSFVKERKQLWTNPAFKTIFGYSQGETEGLDAKRLYADVRDYERIRSEGYARLAQGENYTIEVQGVKKDGSTFWLHLEREGREPEGPQGRCDLDIPGHNGPEAHGGSTASDGRAFEPGASGIGAGDL